MVIIVIIIIIIIIIILLLLLLLLLLSHTTIGGHVSLGYHVISFRFRCLESFLRSLLYLTSRRRLSGVSSRSQVFLYILVTLIIKFLFTAPCK